MFHSNKWNEMEFSSEKCPKSHQYKRKFRTVTGKFRNRPFIDLTICKNRDTK